MAQVPSTEGPAPTVPTNPQNAHGDFFVVGIGASAGGLKALVDLFEHTTLDTGIAYVVVMHLSPDHESGLPILLQRATRMKVTQVTEPVKIEPGHVYVIAPNSQLRMRDGWIESTVLDKHSGARITIDVFLETLAEAHRHRAVGVILSGTGSDGTRGIRAVKAHGGITIAQVPEEAEYEAMPRNAIASGNVDFQLSIHDIATRIAVLWANARHIRLPELPDPISPEDAAAQAEEALRDILAVLRSRTGHDFSQYKRPTLLRRIERRLQVNQLQRLEDYRTFIESQTNESEALLRDLLINVTWFFRDGAAWQALQQRAVSEVLARLDSEPLRLWVIGCATGEEVYTLAMIVQEALDGMADPPAVTIFGTDIDEEALAVARTGVYPESIAEHVSPTRLQRFFVRQRDTYRVQKFLRDTALFALHNVLHDPPFSRLDLVSSRNLLIYLTRHAQTRVLDLIHFALKPESFLFLGLSESIDGEHDGFATVDKTNRIFVQQPRARMGVTLSSLPSVLPQRANEIVAAAGRRTVSFGELHHRLLEHYASPSLVVDDRYEIVHLSDRAGHYLALGPGEPSLHLLKALPQDLRLAVKAALDQALESMQTVQTTGVIAGRGLQPAPLDIKVHPVRDRASGRTFALVVFDEGATETPVSVEAPNDGAREAGSTGLEERLHEMEAQLGAAVEQYEVQNEELRASNEELQATNEELRATTEELETGKEELQSINEELSTVNQELKNKVDETTRISEDLENFVSATEIASLFVDRDMCLMRYTPFARDVFNVIPTDIGRPLLDITHRLENIDLQAHVQRVFDSLTMVEAEARSTDGRAYIARFLPYRTSDDRIRGAVMTFLEITQQKDAELQSRRAEARAKVVVENVRGYAILTIAEDGTIASWSPGAEDIFRYVESEVIGKPFSILFTPEDRAAHVPQAELAQAKETGRGDDERWQLRKDGSRFYASGITARIEVAGHGYVKVLRDLTEQKVAEQRQKELLVAERISRTAAEEANRLKDEFLAMLSHELRNPLAVMLMQAEILLRAPEAKKSDRLRQSANIIHEMVRAQAQLVEDMLDVSRARTGKLAIDRQLLPLTFLIAESIGALRKQAQAKNVTLEVEIAEGPLIVTADPLRVRQIAWNLMSNALKFTPSGGMIHVRLSRDANQARLDVEDTGKGISSEDLPRIFDWFRHAGDVSARQQSGEQGMGIGLALVRQLVELHEGRVEAASEGVGKGARFTVWLPLQVMNVPRLGAPSKSAEGKPKLEGTRVLLVDDVDMSGSALGEMLQLEGALVTVESSPREAIKRAERERFDVLISDIAMPDIDGYAMLKIIRRAGPNVDTPAIAYSGYGSTADVDRARAAGFDTHVTKPADVQKLVATIGEIVRRKRAAD